MSLVCSKNKGANEGPRTLLYSKSFLLAFLGMRVKDIVIKNLGKLPLNIPRLATLVNKLASLLNCMLLSSLIF